MKKKLLAICLAGLMGIAALTGCSRSAAEETTPAESVQEPATEAIIEETSGIKVIENAGEENDKTISVRIVDKNNPALPGRVPEKVRGIYISGPMAGSSGLFQEILDDMENTEINTVVIDLKNDE